MSTETKLARKLRLQVAMAGAASAFLLVPAAFAQSDSAKSPGEMQLEKGPAVEHRQLDENGDQVLQWNELRPRLESAQLDKELDQKTVLGEHDRNGDGGLGPLEYQLFLSRLGNDSNAGQTAQNSQTGESDGGQEVVVQAQQPKVKVDTDPARVKVDPAEPEVAVQQKPPKVKVDPADPKVSVDQRPPKVKITQPEPKVEVTVPRPKVEVVQRDPQVNVQKDKPQVEVEQRKPQVTVNQGKPDVKVAQPEPEVAVVPAKPQVAIDEETQAQVQVKDQQSNAQVEVDQSKPEVQVSGADPKVNVDQAQEADIAYEKQDRPEDRTGNEVAAQDEDLNQLPPTAAGVSSQEQQRQRANRLDNLPVRELNDRVIRNADGQKLGKVDEIVRAKDNNATALVLEVGGILGLGSESVLVPLDQLSLENDQLVWETSKTAKQLKQQDYKEQNYTRVSPENYELVGDLKKGAQ